VISFNRGPWCDYCGLELHSLARAYPEVVSAGGEVVSIVPETAKYARDLQATRGIPFRVLTDMDLGYALSLGLVFWVGQKIMDMYRGFGIDLSQFQGNGGWFLPIPATLVVGRDGRVKALRRPGLPSPHADRRHRRSGARSRPGLSPCRVQLVRHLPGYAKQAGQKQRRIKFSYRLPSLRL
jgi:peroxiredoxin